MDEEDFFEPHPDGTCMFCDGWWTPARKRSLGCGVALVACLAATWWLL